VDAHRQRGYRRPGAGPGWVAPGVTAGAADR
jgi:hypothetical protein